MDNNFFLSLSKRPSERNMATTLGCQ